MHLESNIQITLLNASVVLLLILHNFFNTMYAEFKSTYQCLSSFKSNINIKLKNIKDFICIDNANKIFSKIT